MGSVYSSCGSCLNYKRRFFMKKSSFLKKVIAVSLCAAVSVSMTACGNDSTSDSSTPAPSNIENNSEATSDNSQSAPESSAETSADSASTPAGEKYTLGGELTKDMIAKSRYNEGNKVRLANVIKKLKANEEITVAFIGGSITQGTSAGDSNCYAKLTADWLAHQFPNAKVNYVNAGIGATGSFIGASRVDKDVLSHDPDLVFVEFSVNDTTERTEMNKESYAALLRRIWAHSTSPAIVTIAMTQENGTSFQEYHGEIVKMFDLPMISYKNTILDIIDKGDITWKDISDDNIHPNTPGHALLSKLITTYLQEVIDDVDNISGEESNFDVESDLGMMYMNLQYLNSKDITPTNIGGFEERDSFSNFYNMWSVQKRDGQFTDADAIEFEFEGTNLDLLVGKLRKYFTQADVYIDGELVKTIDCDFTGGWGDYVDMVPVVTGLTNGKHTLKIAPKSQKSNVFFYLAGILVS